MVPVPRSRPLAATRWHGFRGQVLVYVLAGAVLVAIWAVIDMHGFFLAGVPGRRMGIGGVMKPGRTAGGRRSPGKTSTARPGAGKPGRPAVAVFQYGQTRHSTGPVLAAAPGRGRSSCDHEDAGNCPGAGRGRGD